MLESKRGRLPALPIKDRRISRFQGMFAGDLALAVAALFTGAAFYVGFAEQPVRLELDNRALLIEWKRSYKRGFVMQAPLAIVGFLLGLIAWWLSGRLSFLAGAVLLVANYL